jgi:hypothetical protein
MIEECSNFITISKLDSTSYGKQAVFIIFMKSRQYVRIESHRNQENRVLKLFRHVCSLLMSIVEDRRHVYVPSHSIKFDNSHGLMHPFMLT